MTCRAHRQAGQPSVGRHNALRSGILDRRRHTWDRCWADRPPGMPASEIPKLGGFPQVCAGCAACGCFWLNDSEEVRLDKHPMDVDTAKALAGVVGLLRQAALRAWAATDRAGARSPGQLFAFGVDLAADQARHLVPDGTDIDGPVPVGGETAGLLRSAERVWAVSWPAWTPAISISSLQCWGMPAPAGRHVVPQMTRQCSGCDG
jgi:hypothetical protein